MPTSESTVGFVPYKHIALIIVLSIIAIVLLSYDDAPENTEQADSKAPVANKEQVTTIAVPLNLASEQSVKPTAEPVIEPQVAVPESVVEVTPVVVPPREEIVAIQPGDTLSALFDRYDVGQSVLRQILSADESLLALETIRSGQKLFFRYSEDGLALREMELYRDPGYRVVYRRVDEKAFNYETMIREGQWVEERVHGTIEGTFYLSAQRAGLTEIEAATVTQIFQDQLDFARAIRKGDPFQVVRSVQYIDEKATGQTRIESARIQRRAYEHTAFLFDDGRYYDKKGSSLARAFRRTPLAKSYRISSPFNPRRVHPVTGRVGPHNGTDFATPTGTKVLSTGDGVVSRVGNHPFAGRYIDIQHGGQYKTRYLHLHRVLVRRGQSITRGQTIALSGNTGRSTGPHLHFELHINGRPVNPMKAKIPISHSVPKENKSAFAKIVKYQTGLLNGVDKEVKVAVRQDQ